MQHALCNISMTTQTVTKPPTKAQTPPPAPTGTDAGASPPVPATPTLPIPTRTGYAVTVRRARGVLRFLLIATLVAGIATTVVGFFAVNRALDSYSEIVADSARSADAAQSARSAILAHHSAAADTLSLAEGTARNEARVRTETEWQNYQLNVRRVWQNRSDQQFGEFAVFDAADIATWRYRAKVDAVMAFLDAGETERAQQTFLEAHTLLIREVLPALNGLASVKLESMEAAYSTTSEGVNQWLTTLIVVGGASVLLLITGFALTRLWLRYAWTWELLLASVVAVALFLWFNYSLSYAASEVETLVRSAYDSIAGVQTVESYVTQAEALESMAIFAPQQSTPFLEDSQEYLFLAEQRLCGELACTDADFGGDAITFNVRDAALAGQGKYGLPDAPLVANASTNDFEGEPAALTALGNSIRQYRSANAVLINELAGGQQASEQQRTDSRNAYLATIEAVRTEQTIVRNEFNNIYSTVTSWMEVNLWLTALFTVVAVLGAVGLRRRRMSLFP
jgi:FtsH-binding integral membrane protein